MSFDYHWENNEANFGSPIKKEVNGGTHITFEVILRHQGKYVALRRPNANPGHEIPTKAKDFPNGCLYFCHNLIRYGETIDECIRRIVKDGAHVNVEEYEVVKISSELYENPQQWAFNPIYIANIDRLPKTTDDDEPITEIVTFTPDQIPDEFGWWTVEELREVLT